MGVRRLSVRVSGVGAAGPRIQLQLQSCVGWRPPLPPHSPHKSRSRALRSRAALSAPRCSPTCGATLIGCARLSQERFARLCHMGQRHLLCRGCLTDGRRRVGDRTTIEAEERGSLMRPTLYVAVDRKTHAARAKVRPCAVRSRASVMRPCAVRSAEGSWNRPASGGPSRLLGRASKCGR